MMNGQWMGEFTGSNSGLLVVNIDDMGDHYEGHAVAFDSDSDLPDAFVPLVTPDKLSVVKIKVPISPIDPRTRAVGSADTIAQHYPKAELFSKWADVTISYKESDLNLEWETDAGFVGEATLPRSKGGELSEYQAINEVTSWDDFKRYVNELKPRKYIFRGQRDGRRLRTSFHRAGRADLLRFRSEDIPRLHRHLSNRTRHLFNLQDADQYGAFYNLVQHHGYPTPLLDWTYSPYVAAFFAFRRVGASHVNQTIGADKVRIFVFDYQDWKMDVQQSSFLFAVPPHFSVAEFVAIDNERLVPQQSVSTVTNIDDIESYIRMKENELRKAYLSVIELPLSARGDVMKELALMGITAGALFPGIDGACEELRQLMFFS